LRVICIGRIVSEGSPITDFQAHDRTLEQDEPRTRVELIELVQILQSIRPLNNSAIRGGAYEDKFARSPGAVKTPVELWSIYRNLKL
jgi:hypothetical protein